MIAVCCYVCEQVVTNSARNDSKHLLFYCYELIADDGRSGDSYNEDQRMTLRKVSGICPSFVTLVSIFAGKK